VAGGQLQRDQMGATRYSRVRWQCLHIFIYIVIWKIFYWDNYNLRVMKFCINHL